MPISRIRQMAQARAALRVPPGTLTAADFLARLTLDQQVAIEMAAGGNDQPAAMVRVVDKALRMAPWVDPGDAHTAVLLDTLIVAVPDAFGATPADRLAARARILAPVAGSPARQ